MKHAKTVEQSKAKRTKCPSDIQTCQVSILRMSEKFVDPPNNVSSITRNIVWAFKGIMYPRLAEIAFHGISAVKIKCHLTIYF